MISDTSTKAYKEDALPTLSERQEAVLEALKGLGEATNTELAESLHWSINRVTPRIFELRRQKRVVEIGKRACKITGRTAYVWSAKLVQSQLPIAISLCCGASMTGSMCNKCRGIGGENV